METKPLLYGIVGFIVGGLLVSIAATTFDKPGAHDDSPVTMDSMVTSLQGKQGDDFDKTFLADMIAHHQAAVDMAKLSTGRAKHEQLKQLSDAIVSAQEKEIREMKQWQNAWGYTTSGTDQMEMSH